MEAQNSGIFLVNSLVPSIGSTIQTRSFWVRDGSATVSVVVRDRPWNAVLGDMIEGFAAANHPDSAPRLRDLLWGVLETIELDADDTSGAHVITLPKVA